jgi:hypothetical protein
MATITAALVNTSDSLDTFRQRFNTLRSDIQGLSFGAEIVFEGTTADDFETTLLITDPTADRIVTIQDKSGIIALTGRDINDIVLLNATDGSGTDEASTILLNASAAGVDAGDALLYEEGTNDHILNPTFEGVEEFIILEESLEGTPSFALRENVDSSSLDARFAYQPATSDNLLGALFLPPAAGGIQFIMPINDGAEDQVLATDGSGSLSFKNQSSGMSLANDGNNRVVTANGAGSGNGEANLNFNGSALAVTGTVTASGFIKTDSTTDATSTTDGSLQTDGGLSVALDTVIGNDVILISDASVIHFGVNSDVSLTHVHDTGLLLNGTSVIQFNDASQSIGAPSNAILDINATDEIELNATLVDVNANLDVSGSTTSASFVVADGGNIGSASDTNAITISSAGVVAVTATTASTNATTGALTVAGGAGIAADLGIGDDLCMISDDSYVYFGVNKEVFLKHRHDKGLSISDGGAFSGTDGDGQVLTRRGADVLLVMNQSAAAGTDAGDNILLDGTDGSATNAGDNITMENMPFLHAGMQRNVIEIRDSGGQLLNSVAGFAPGAI